MAITGSTPSGATAATATAGSAAAASSSDAAATPGDFLGMLGTLVQAAAQSAAQVTGQAADQPAADQTAAVAATPVDATQAAVLSEALPPLLASLGAEVAPTATPAGKPSTLATDTRSDSDPAASPEAAASAAAVLAQMLAVAQPVAQTAAAATPPEAEVTAAATAAPPKIAAPSALADVAATADTAAAAPFVPALQFAAASLAANDAQIAGEDGTQDIEVASDASANAAQDASAARPFIGTAQAIKPTALDGLLTSISSAPYTKDNPTTDSSGFRSLASLLGAGAQRAEAGVDASINTATQPQALQAVLSQPASASASEAVAADAMPDRLREPVGSEKWADALGARLTMLASRGEQHGSLRLSPEHLGPLEVQIRVQDDKASVWFGAQHPETRAALQDALPRLRELFAASGMQLGDAGVSREAPRQDRTPADLLAGGSGGESVPVEEPILSAAVVSIAHSGLLDTYA